MKKTLYTFVSLFALSASCALASNQMGLEETKDPKKTATQSVAATEDFKGNWTGTYQTKLGVASHTPQRVTVGFMSSGKTLTMGAGMSMNGVKPTGDLVLYVNSTKEEFEAALKKSGLY